MSYVCGWFMLIGILAMGATNNFITANFILGAANLNNPGYVIKRWHTVLTAYAVAFVADLQCFPSETVGQSLQRSLDLEHLRLHHHRGHNPSHQ